MSDKRHSDGTKLLWHMQRVSEHFDQYKKIAPIHLDCGIAKFCNISCTYCFGKFQNMKNVFIQQEALLRLVRDANEIGVKSMAFIGDGEPTCNTHMYEALTVARDETSLDMAISTNGVLINSVEKCDTILSSCKWMRFCLSAGTREGYKKIHGKDYFDIVLENVKRMVEVKKEKGYTCDIGLQAVFDPTIMKEEMILESALAVKLGVDYFVIKQCSLPDAGESGMSVFDLKEYDSEETHNALKACEETSTDKTKIIVKWNTMKQKGVRPYNGCLSVPLISEISGNGNWFPCGYFFDDKPEHAPYKFGNIQEKSLKEIFNSKHYWEVIERMKKFDVHKDCHGACRLDSTNKFCYDYLDKPMGINFI